MFCTSLEPKLFTIDLLTVEHLVFFSELHGLREAEDIAEDTALKKLPCYKNVSNFIVCAEFPKPPGECSSQTSIRLAVLPRTLGRKVLISSV